MDIVGKSEVRWPDEGDFWSNDHRIIYSGHSDRTTGVAIILTKKWRRRVKSYFLYSDRIVMIKLEAGDRDIVIIQVYTPTTGSEDEEAEDVYDQLEEVMDYVDKKYNLIILGDWDAVVGEGKEHNITGHYGFGVRNKRGKRLIDFVEKKNLLLQIHCSDNHCEKISLN